MTEGDQGLIQGLLVCVACLTLFGGLALLTAWLVGWDEEGDR